MKTTANNLLRLLALVSIALCLVACKTGSTLLSSEQGIKPEPPRVSCKQRDTSDPPPAPRDDEWVLGGQLSERASNWILEVLGVATKRKDLLTEEHACLDRHEKAGDIRQ